MMKVLTVAQLKKHLRVSDPTARQLLRTGKIQAVKVGRAWRVPEQALNQFLTGGDKNNEQSKSV